MSEHHRTPIFNPNAEAHAMQALNAVMMIFQTTQRPIGPERLVELDHALAKLVDCLFPIDGYIADFAGYAPLPAGHYVHPIKTAEAAALLGRQIGLPRSKLITLATSAALMNVGYLLLKQSLIDEPRKLMDGAWEAQMHTHPAQSIAALTAANLPHEAIVAIGQHHERWDGSGYPHGVRGDDICLEARILAIADTFIALRSQRPHRHGMPTEQALQIIREGAGQLYEPDLVAAFVSVITTYADKEERKAAAASSSTDASPAETVDSQNAQQSQRPHEDVVSARRDEQQQEDESTSPRQRSGIPKRTLALPATIPFDQPITRVPAADPSMPATAVATAAPPRAARRPRPRQIPPSAIKTARRPRSLFSTDVYIRSLSGHWLD